MNNRFIYIDIYIIIVSGEWFKQFLCSKMLLKNT